jgi:hypothetical protein
VAPRCEVRSCRDIGVELCKYHISTSYLLNFVAPTGNISYEDLKAAVDEALPQRGGEIMLTIADTLIEQS